jgi:hypothetical protein
MSPSSFPIRSLGALYRNRSGADGVSSSSVTSGAGGAGEVAFDSFFCFDFFVTTTGSVGIMTRR